MRAVELPLLARTDMGFEACKDTAENVIRRASHKDQLPWNWNK